MSRVSLVIPHYSCDHRSLMNEMIDSAMEKIGLDFGRMIELVFHVSDFLCFPYIHREFDSNTVKIAENILCEMRENHCVRLLETQDMRYNLYIADRQDNSDACNDAPINETNTECDESKPTLKVRLFETVSACAAYIFRIFRRDNVCLLLPKNRLSRKISLSFIDCTFKSLYQRLSVRLHQGILMPDAIHPAKRKMCNYG